jgi:hypothetical protein
MSDRGFRIVQLRAKGSEVGTRLRRLRAALPFDPVPLLIMIVGGGLVAYSLRSVHEWHIMNDEMLYQKLSYGVLDGHLFPGWVRNQPTDLRNTLFPTLIAPLFGLLSVPAAVRGVITLNAFVMASAAIPAFLIARDVLGRRLHAYLVAAMVAATPWAIQSANVLTESTAYAAFAWAVWGIYYALRRRGVRGDLVALALLAVAYLARTQFIVLIPLLPAAVLLHELVAALAERQPGSHPLRAAWSGVRTAVREHLVVWAVVVVAAFYVLVIADASSLLGTYSGTSEGDLLPPGIWQLSLQNVAGIAMGIGAVPLAFALGWALSTIWRGQHRPQHAFAVVFVLVIPALTIAATSFDIRYAGGTLAERYLFYIAPVVLIGFGAFFTYRRSVLWLILGTAAAIYVLTRSNYTAIGSPYASPASFFSPVLHGRADQLTGFVGWHPPLTTFVAVAVSVFVLLAYVGLRRLGPRVFGLVGAVVLIVLVGQLHYLLPRVSAALDAQPLSFLGARDPVQRDWIDRATTPDDVVGLVDGPFNWRAGQPYWDPNFQLYSWWDVEFWNKRIHSAYGVETTGFTLQPGGYATPNFDTGAWDLTLQDHPTHLVMSTSDTRLAPVGRKVVEAELYSLYELEQPVRLAWMSQGLGTDGWTDPAARAIVRIFGAPDGPPRQSALTVRAYTGADVPGGRRVTLRVGDRHVTRFVETVEDLSITACVPAGAHADVRVVPHGQTDRGGRLVGVRLVKVTAAPTGRPC